MCYVAPVAAARVQRLIRPGGWPDLWVDSFNRVRTARIKTPRFGAEIQMTLFSATECDHPRDDASATSTLEAKPNH